MVFTERLQEEVSRLDDALVLEDLIELAEQPEDSAMALEVELRSLHKLTARVRWQQIWMG